jgi:hypothetical protein
MNRLKGPDKGSGPFDKSTTSQAELLLEFRNCGIELNHRHPIGK